MLKEVGQGCPRESADGDISSVSATMCLFLIWDGGPRCSPPS